MPKRGKDRGLEPATDDDALREWRGKATDLVTAASAIFHAPVLVLLLTGHDPVLSSPVKAIGGAAYLALVAAAAFRRIDQGLRAWVVLGALYATAIVGGVASPQGPYFRALPLVAPMLAIGVLGVRAARVSTVLSAVVLMSVPLLHSQPGIARLLNAAPGQTPLRLAQLWMPGVALTVEMVVLMVLLERFYGHLLQAVAAERRAAAERTAASRTLERETEERQRLEGEITRAGDDERRRLGHEIHDGVCQQLTGALLRCQALETRLARGTALHAEDLGALSSLLAEAIHEARAVAQGLCPVEPTPDALGPALRALAKRTRQTSGVSCEFHAAGDVLVPDPATAQHLYRIAQEALNNAVRHARANRIAIDLRGESDSLFLRVEDDGVGLPDTLPSGGMGLRTMSFRAQVLEGELAVEAGARAGTRVSCRVPRPAFVPPQRRPLAISGGRET